MINYNSFKAGNCKISSVITPVILLNDKLLIFNIIIIITIILIINIKIILIIKPWYYIYAYLYELL